MRIFGLGVVVLSLMLLLVFAACRPEPEPLLPPEQGRLPSSEELRPAAQRLFADVGAAVEAGDAQAFYGLMAGELRERCTLGEVQASLATGEAPVPTMEVKAVYLDVEDHNRAMAQMDMLEVPGGMEDLATAMSFVFPWPMVRENGDWRFTMPSLVLAFLPAGTCPLAAAAPPQEWHDPTLEWGDPGFPPPEIIALTQIPQLEPPLGVITLPEGGSIYRPGWASGSALLETDMPLAALLEHYRQQVEKVLKPGWAVERETVAEDVAMLVWTLRDEDDRPWVGELEVRVTGDNERRVRLMMTAEELWMSIIHDTPPIIEIPWLEPPPGIPKHAGRGERGEAETFDYLVLETDMTLAALLDYYQQRMKEPGWPAWTVLHEVVDEELAVLIWTFRDDADHPWFGVLSVTSAQEDLRWVRLWTGGGVPMPR